MPSVWCIHDSQFYDVMCDVYMLFVTVKMSRSSLPICLWLADCLGRKSKWHWINCYSDVFYLTGRSALLVFFSYFLLDNNFSTSRACIFLYSWPLTPNCFNSYLMFCLTAPAKLSPLEPISRQPYPPLSLTLPPISSSWPSKLHQGKLIKVFALWPPRVSCKMRRYFLTNIKDCGLFNVAPKYLISSPRHYFLLLAFS